MINARILWTFSAAARVLGDAAYREMADWAYDYIVNKFWDKKFGGVYWMLDYQGNPHFRPQADLRAGIRRLWHG